MRWKIPSTSPILKDEDEIQSVCLGICPLVSYLSREDYAAQLLLCLHEIWHIIVFYFKLLLLFTCICLLYREKRGVLQLTIEEIISC